MLFLTFLALVGTSGGEDIELCLGEHHIGYKDGPEQFIAPAIIVLHAEYDRYTISNDIMLIKLAEPAKLDEYVQPIALPSSCAPAGTQCLVSGWGATKSPWCVVCNGELQGVVSKVGTLGRPLDVKMNVQKCGHVDS